MKFELFTLNDIFDSVGKGFFHASNKLNNGDVALIGCGFLNQGLEGFFDIPEKKTHKNAVTITGDGSYPLTAFFHPYSFGAKDNVVVCTPGLEMPLSAIFYILFTINKERWRFSYGRKCYLRKMEEIHFLLPVDETKKLNLKYMDNVVRKSSPYWKIFEKNTRS